MNDSVSQNQEQTFVENPFGTVTSKRVIFFRSKGLFSGGSREDIPLQHVTSVRLDINRSILAAIVLLLIGLGTLASESALAMLVGVLLISLAVILLWGMPTVVVNTAGTDLNAAKGFPWQRPLAQAFVDALRHQLFQK